MPNPKKRILRTLKIDEVSAVTHPANEHCKMALLKRDTRKDDDVKAQEIFNKTMGAPMAFTDFEDAVAHIYKAEGTDRTTAWQRAADRYPQLVQQYRASGLAAVAKARLIEEQAQVQKAHPAEQKWNMAVSDIANNEGCSSMEASRRARRRHDDLYRAMQES